ncbi:MAG: ribonuclease P protein component [Candidatus Parcubacteria bacterium]|nr:ribonuclease P protein component [Candidatus Parcubacteria bacterium]
MFPKKNRITKTRFDELMKKGRVLHSPSFSLRYSKGLNVLPRFAFVVSKKVAKNAVDRNLLRRRGFSILRDLGILKQENVWKGFFGTFFYKKEGKEMKIKELKKEIEEILRKVGKI